MPAKRKTPRPRARARKSGLSISQLIVQTISASKDRTGMSLPTLKKVLAASGYDVKRNQGRIRVAIRSLVNRGVLVKTKGFGASAAYKINKVGARRRSKKRTSRRARPKARRGRRRRRAAKKGRKPRRRRRRARKGKRSRKARRRPRKAGRRARARKAPARRRRRRRARRAAS